MNELMKKKSANFLSGKGKKKKLVAKKTEMSRDCGSFVLTVFGR